MSGFNFDELEVEPEATPETAETLRDVMPTLDVETSATNEPPVEIVPFTPRVVQVLPEDFNLQLLLNFLPDVRLKKDLDDAAEAALAIEVKGADGIALADAALPDLQDRIKFIQACFEEPVAKANALHKRLTGLRADFLARGETAVNHLKNAIKAEDARLKKAEDDARRAAQAEADRLAREDAARAAAKAEKAQAAPAVVEALKERAKTATAPPVSAPSLRPAARATTTVENWKARFAGDASENANPESVADMTDEQRRQFIELARAAIDGKAPLSVIMPDWKYLNGRAKGDKRAFLIPGVEAYDAGSVRRKK